MNDTPLRNALRKLLAQGEMVADRNMQRAAGAKNAPPAVAEQCPECNVPLVDGKCPKCGYEAQGEDESELAATLEQGAEE
ncbi:MAG: hypothetical protein RL409_760 [Gemmatimonadota bacterium]|jgi:uncharacterized Zn finger protein (UPF0148 family)